MALLPKAYPLPPNTLLYAKFWNIPSVGQMILGLLNKNLGHD